MEGKKLKNLNEIVFGKERFVSIPGFSRYMISDWGRVINLQTGRVMAEKYDRTSNKDKAYVKHCLISDEGKDCYPRRNRLVLLSFLGVALDSRKGMEVDHINGNQQDDRLVNLQLISPEENKSRKTMRRKTLKKSQTEMFFPDSAEEAA